MKKSHWHQSFLASVVETGTLTELRSRHTGSLYSNAQSAAGPDNFARFVDKICGLLYSVVPALIIPVT